jgi:hypothetical protein
MSPAEIVRTVRNFIRWHAGRFDALDEEHEAIDNPAGYQRGVGDRRKFWIKPAVWAEELCGDEMDPQDVARTLKELGLLRTQDDREFQIVAKVRGKSTRVYAVRNAILTWRPPVTARRYGGYCAPEPELRIDQNNGCSAVALSAPPSAPPLLTSLLEQAACSALMRGLEILSLSADPDDRHYAAVLRSQVAMAGHVLGIQVRVDEAKLRESEKGRQAERAARAREAGGRGVERIVPGGSRKPATIRRGKKKVRSQFSNTAGFGYGG